MSFFNLVYARVMKIPRGKVASYGQVAAAVDKPTAARAVGYALHKNPSPGLIPCHRVVFRDGSLCEGFAFGGKDEQEKLLKAEGVLFNADGRVNMPVCRFDIKKED